jgi:hypothetical protein
MNANRVNIDNLEEEDLLLKSRPLIEIGKEYRRLVTIKSPSDDEINKIDRILELAIYDPGVDNLINEIDQEISSHIVRQSIVLESELALSEDKHDSLYKCNNCVINHASHRIQETNFSRQQILENILAFINNLQGKFVVGGFSLLMVGLVFHCHQIIWQNTFSKLNMIPEIGAIQHDIRQSQNIKSTKNGTNLANSHETNQDLKNQFTNLEVQNAYDYLQQLEISDSDTSQSSRKIALMIAERIQFKAEFRQIEAESKQRNAEQKQITAELENHNDLALRWRTKAKIYLKESRQWLSLAQNSVAIVKQLSEKG